MDNTILLDFIQMVIDYDITWSIYYKIELSHHLSVGELFYWTNPYFIPNEVYSLISNSSATSYRVSRERYYDVFLILT